MRAMQIILSIWTWYINLFSDPDNKIRIAAWTATIGTLTFIITLIIKPLISWQSNKRSKVKVELGIRYELVASLLGTGVQSVLLTVTITNLTERPVFIENPCLKTSQKIDGNDKFYVPQPSGSFPKKIESHEQFKIDFDANAIAPQLFSSLLKSDTIHFVVQTTVGKVYESNELKVSHIQGHIQVSNDLNNRN
jgi:hypothetical protein